MHVPPDAIGAPSMRLMLPCAVEHAREGCDFSCLFAAVIAVSSEARGVQLKGADRS